ncbi:hypothetical protein C2G38_1346909 [Gigaspora rosea]|uniref:C2H2-type domain-containing protein n=1 Tax=Gigaspora rosea TaxID=44941 RepID=A0A397V7R6_9GLOM|nr:hypothetical protein C2G38_1346909 [Gigaspora rosea]
MESKPRLIAPTPKHHQINTSTSSMPANSIDSPRFHRAYHFYPSFQSRDTKPIINNWMMPVFSLHAPTSHHFPSSTSLNNQNHLYMMPFPHNNSHLTVATTSQLQQPQSNAYSINGVSNHNSSLSSSSLSRNRHKCDWPGCTWSFKRLEHLKRHMITHTGERKYTCTYPGCGKKFGRSDNFSAHCKTHNKSNQRKSRKSTNIIDAELSNNINLDNRGLSDLLTNDLSNNMSSSNNMSCEMTSTSQAPTLTQDQLDAFHYYCDTTITTTSNSSISRSSSINEDTNNSADHSSVRFRECY